MSLAVFKAFRHSPEYSLKIGDEFEVRYPENEKDFITADNRVESQHEFQITQAMLETLGKPFRLG